jgi:hypothetical protein
MEPFTQMPARERLTGEPEPELVTVKLQRQVRVEIALPQVLLV